ncbi:MAG: UDP-glucose/GDP-mannose dehydrogenase family protein [Chloroflexi bacterium]|nr:UDP-glucose/GDP-mannose dehydrogenase family protein [Chloroflexota bacterium]
MKVSVFGLGYVGCVSAACLAHDGHEVIGVDISPQKVELVRSGKSPIVEPGLDELVGAVVRAGKLQASQDAREAVRNSDISLICVGTPSNGNGSLDLRHVRNVCKEIGAGLAAKRQYHVVVVRSTLLPGSTQYALIPLLEMQSRRCAGGEFGVCTNPEFLREGSAIDDYYHPSYIVIGELDERSGDTVQEMYRSVESPFVRLPIRTAEIVKYVSNAFHAVKVAFANEIGDLCKANGIDGQQVMELICQDARLNLSPAYLTPGFAFGGSCLPKDLRALLYRAKELDLDCPLLEAVRPSNQKQIQRGIKMVEDVGRKKVGVFGLSFKVGTDDVRESPVIPLIETLVGRGYQVSVYDEKVRLAELVGANKSFLEQQMPHIASLMRSSIHQVLDTVDVVVIANGSPAFRQVPELVRPDQVLVDLVGLGRGNAVSRGMYEGICW